MLNPASPPRSKMLVPYTLRFRFSCIEVCVSVGPVGTENQELLMQHADRPSTSIEGLGPRLALKRIAPALNDQVAKRQWVEQARIKAILGSCPKTRQSALSGMRCWCTFAQNVLDLKGREFPPPLDGLLAWSTLFRCKGTFANYLGHVKLACEMVSCST